jgi:LysR family transcriptional regulator, glycine cleavage system transcriptional activator
MRLSHPPRTQNLRAFCVAARHRSFKVAADELFLTPSAVSHQMKELEELLGIRLFERKTRGLELTAAGQRLLEDLEPLLEALDRMLTQFARRTERRAVRVRLPSFFAQELFIPRLQDFCDAHPEIDLLLETREPRPATHPPTADVSILLAQAPPAGLESVRLFSSPLIAVCSPDHAAGVARLGREVFASLPLIADQARPGAWTAWAEEIGLETPEPKQRIELDTMAAVVRAAERGLGIALVPRVLCEARLRSGTLVPIFAVELANREAYYLVCRQKDSERAEVKAVHGWVLAQFSRG